MANIKIEENNAEVDEHSLCMQCGAPADSGNYIPLCKSCLEVLKNGNGSDMVPNGDSLAVGSLKSLVNTREDIAFIKENDTRKILILPRYQSEKMNDTEAVCTQCGRTYTKVNSNQYVCGACMPVRICEKCAGEFLAEQPLKYCSRVCADGKAFNDLLLINRDELSKRLSELNTEQFELSDEDWPRYDDKLLILIIDGKEVMPVNGNLSYYETRLAGHKITVWKVTRDFNEYALWDILGRLYVRGAKYIDEMTEGDLKFLYKQLSDVLVSIRWGDVTVGAEFPDGSRLVGTKPVEYRKTYRVILPDRITIVADTHLVKAEILDADGDRINDECELSRLLRERLGEEDDSWLAVDDLYEFSQYPEMRVEIGGVKPVIERVDVTETGELPVRCVETDTHQYTIGMLVNHNCARYLYFGLSDMYIMEGECSASDSSNSILTCTAPGGFCEHCARKAGMGKVLDQLKKEQLGKGVGTIKIGGLISTNLSEPTTQLYLDAIHSAGGDQSEMSHTHIVGTFEGYTSSPVIKKAAAMSTTVERRQALYEGLRDLYKANDVAIDDWNLQAVAKKMTSYKRTKAGLKLINEQEGELCDIVSIRNIGGNSSGNVFKRSTFMTAYDTISKGGKVTMNAADSFNDIFREDFDEE